MSYNAIKKEFTSYDMLSFFLIDGKYINILVSTTRFYLEKSFPQSHFSPSIPTPYLYINRCIHDLFNFF